jgi:hypothetical protein
MCDCDKKIFNMGCCTPVLAPIANYYTKYQVDKLIESATTSGCCITPEEVDEKISSAMTEVEGEIPSLSGYATEQWVLEQHYTSGVDLSDYAKLEDIPTSNSAFTNDEHYITSGDSVFNSYYTKTEVNNLVSDKIWCGTQTEYNNLSPKQNDVLYLIHE